MQSNPPNSRCITHCVKSIPTGPRRCRHLLVWTPSDNSSLLLTCEEAAGSLLTLWLSLLVEVVVAGTAPAVVVMALLEMVTETLALESGGRGKVLGGNSTFIEEKAGWKPSARREACSARQGTCTVAEELAQCLRGSKMVQGWHTGWEAAKRLKCGKVPLMGNYKAAEAQIKCCWTAEKCHNGWEVGKCFAGKTEWIPSHPPPYIYIILKSASEVN